MKDQKNYYPYKYTYIEIAQDYIQFDSKDMPKFKALHNYIYISSSLQDDFKLHLQFNNLTIVTYLKILIHYGLKI